MESTTTDNLSMMGKLSDIDAEGREYFRGYKRKLPSAQREKTVAVVVDEQLNTIVSWFP